MTTKSFDANRRRKVYPVNRRLPIIRFESDSSGSNEPVDIGIASIWSTFGTSAGNYLTWSALDDIDSPRENDEALVVDSDGLGNPAVARYSTVRSQWELWQAQFSVYTHMFNFPRPIRPGATAIFLGRAFQWASITLPGTITRFTWLLEQDITASPDVIAFVDGNEDAPTVDDQGWTLIENGTYTLDSVDGFFRLLTAASSSSAAIRSNAIESTTKIRIRLEIKASATSNGDASIIAVGDGTNQANLYFTLGTVPSNRLQFINNSGFSLYASHAYRDGSIALPNIANEPILIELVDEGAAIGIDVFINGQFYGRSQRLTSGTTVNFSDGVYIGSTSGSLGNGQDTRIRNVLVYTVS